MAIYVPETQPRNPAMTAPTAGYGTLALSDLLRVNNTSVIDFGRQDVFRVIREFFNFVNAILNEQLNELCERTTERALGVGGPVATQARFTDEFGVADASKVAGAAQLGFPLRKHQVNRQWTAQWMRKHTPQEMAAQAQAAAVADLQLVQFSLRKAIFNPANFTWVDNLVDYMSVFCKPFANADGFPIPPSPNGYVFDPTTHTHYMNSPNTYPGNGDIAALTRNVFEHFSAGQGRLYVTEDFGDALIAGAGTTYPDFVKLTYTDQVYPTTLTLGRGVLEPVNQANRQIGVFRGVQVWVKPWIPLNVCLMFVIGGTQKPLAMRIPNDLGGDNGDFRPIWDDDQYPTQCEVLEREYGFGVQNRVGGAVMSYNNTNGTTYTAPSYSTGSAGQ